MAASFDRVVNQLVRFCLFWAAIDSLFIAQMLLPRSRGGFYVHMSSGLLLVVLLALQYWPTAQKWRGSCYGLLVVIFWALVSYYAPLWHDAGGRMALVGLLVWLLPLLAGAGFVLQQAFIGMWTVAWGTLIVLAWAVYAPSDQALQARAVPDAAVIAACHVVTASLSSVGVGMLGAHYRHAYRMLAATAGRDYLTGLVNRGRLYELLRQEMARASRQHRPLSLIFYDIDNFGQINKQHGHPIGDRVLRTFSQQVQDHLRDNDHLGRWGGEEFMAIIPDTTLEDTYQLAERLRETLATTAIAPVGIITASFGVVTWHLGDSIESLLARLDVAVRNAKWQGKNRVMVMQAQDEPNDF